MAVKIDEAHAPSQAAPAQGQAPVIAPEALPDVCPTKLVRDRPIEGDEADGEGAHQRLASALADLMRYEKVGGVSVGLEGSWGSGKTSVLKLLLNELRKAGELVERPRGGGGGECDFAVVTFDAWAHEKDPLRRTFLETVIPHLLGIGWVRERDRWRWERRLQIIAQRLESKTTDSTPRLAPAGIAAVLSLFLVPIGNNLFSDSLKTAEFVFDAGRPRRPSSCCRFCPSPPPTRRRPTPPRLRAPPSSVS